MKTIITLLSVILVLLYSASAQNCNALYNVTIEDSTNTAYFYDSSSTQIGNIVSWSWDFGDGSTGSGSQVSHTYAHGGTYDVCLSILTSDSCHSTFCDSLHLSGPLDPCYGFHGELYVQNATSDSAADGAVYSWFYGYNYPISFQWSNSSTTEDLIGVSAGTYTVTVTDNMGCTLINSANVLVDSSAACNAFFTYSDSSGTHFSFHDLSTGFVNSNHCTWLWDFGDGTSSTSRNPYHVFDTTGSYVVCLTISTDVGCVSTFCDSISASYCSLDATAQITEISEVFGTDGAIDITVTGGTPPYSFSWSNGSTIEDQSGLSEGYYSVYITDSMDCNAYLGISLQDPPCSFELAVDYVQETDTLACDGYATAIITGTNVSPGLSYIWHNGETTPSISGLCSGNVAVTVTEPNGCSVSQHVYHNYYGDTTGTGSCNLYVAYIVTNESAPGNSDGALDIIVYGGATPYSYSWSNGHFSESITGLAHGLYTVDITDSNGCSETLTIAVGIEPVNHPVDTLWTTPWDTCITVVDFGVDTFMVTGPNTVEVIWAITDINGTIYLPVTYQANLNGATLVTLLINCTNGLKSMTALFDVIVIDQLTTITGVSDMKLTLYPNPVKSTLSIDTNEKLIVSIFDESGKKVVEEVILGTGQIDVSEIKPGIYIVIGLNPSGSVCTSTIIKE